MKSERFRFVKLLSGVADLTGAYDSSTHVKLAKNPFVAEMDTGDREVFLIQCPGLTRRSVTAMQGLLHHLLDEPETLLAMQLHIIAVEIDEEDDEILIDNYYVVTTETAVYICLGGCTYNDEGRLGDSTLDTLFVGLAQTLSGQPVHRYRMPLITGQAITPTLGDYYSEWCDIRRQLI
jgi:hypothetical protein